MNNIFRHILTLVMVIASTNAAFSHPSLSHDGNEGILHEASFAVLVIAAVLIGAALIKRYQTK